MNTTAKIFLVFLVGIMIAGACGYIFIKRAELLPSPGHHKPGLEAEFERVLNDLLKGVYADMQSYKEQRKVMTSLVRPENLRDEKYVEENYQMMENVSPVLRERMRDVLQQFKKADQSVEGLLAGADEARSDEIRQSWQEFKEENVQPYYDYFILEERILTAYEDLITFYYIHAGEFSYHAGSNSLVFNEPELSVREDEFRNEIAALTQEQKSQRAEETDNLQ